MSKERYNFYVIVVLVAIAQNAFDMNFNIAKGIFDTEFNIVLVLISTLFVILVVFVRNNILKKLTIWQKLGVVVLHVVVILIASRFLHVLLGFILHYIANGWMLSAVKFILLILTLIPVFNVLSVVGLKLTDQKFKVIESGK